MTRPSSQLLASLGIDQGSTDVLDSCTIATPNVGRGLTTSEPVTALFEPFLVHDLELPGFERRHGRARASNRDPRVFAVEYGQAVRRRTDSVSPMPEKPGVLLFDTRMGPAAALFEDGLVIAAQQSEVWVLDSSPLHDWTPPDPIDLAIPDLDRLLGGRKAPDWLLRDARALALDSHAYSRAVAVGLLGRLWIPEGERFGVDEMVAGEGPTAAALAWFSDLSEATRERIQHDALIETDELIRSLTELETEAEVRGFVQRRDDLECIAFLFADERPGTQLDRSLGELDRLASNWYSTFSTFDFSSDERLRAVSWQEPEQWWGMLAP